MAFCGQCGKPVNGGTPGPVPADTPPPRRAPEPGPAQQVATQVAPPPPASPTPAAGTVLPPPPPAAAGGTGGVPIQFDAQKVLRPVLVGNWVAAGAVALTALMVSGLLSFACILVAKPADFGVDNALTAIAVLMTGSFGADVVVTSGREAFDGSLSAGWFPLTITLATMASSAYVFRRFTAGYARASAALADGVRAALLTAIPLTAIALVFRADNDDFGPTWVSDLATSDRESLLDIGASAVGSFFMSLIVMTVVLALACALRRDWLPGRLARLHDWFAAPLWGAATIAGALPVAGAIGIASVLLFGDDNGVSDLDTDEWMTLVGLGVAYLANAGFAVLTLGSGASVGTDDTFRYNGGGDSGHSSYDEFHRLTYFTGNDAGVNETGLWISVAVVPLVLLLAAYVVARKSSHRGAVMGNLLRYSGLLLVVIPLMSRLASVHAGADVKSDGTELLGDYVDGKASASVYVGSNGLEVTFFLFFFALLAAALVAALAGALDVNKLKGQAAGIARQMQAQPDQQQYQQPQPPYQQPHAAPGTPPQPAPQSAPQEYTQYQ